MPNKCRHQLNVIMFWIHLLQMNNERMVKKVYNECKSLTDNHNHKNWVWEIKSTLAKCGLNSWWHQSSCDELLYGEAKHLVTSCLFRLERENWKSDIASKTKLRWYIQHKADYGKTQGYVQRTRVKAHRSPLACKVGEQSHCRLRSAGMSAFLWKKDHVRHAIQAWWTMRSTSVWVAQV